MQVPQGLKQVQIQTFLMTTTAGVARSVAAGGPGGTGPVPAVGFMLQADSSNGSSVYWGWSGTVEFPLVTPNGGQGAQAVTIDLPAGYFVDMNDLTIAGGSISGGTAGLKVHCVVFVASA